MQGPLTVKSQEASITITTSKVERAVKGLDHSKEWRWLIDPGSLKDRIDSQPTRMLLHVYEPEKAKIQEQKANSTHPVRTC